MNQFRTDDETKRDEELIENEIFLSPIVESALGLDTNAREGNSRNDDYLLSPDGDDAQVITRRSSKNELALSMNSHNKMNINYEVSNCMTNLSANNPDNSMTSNQSLRKSKFCTQCGYQFQNIADKFCGACGSKRT